MPGEYAAFHRALRRWYEAHGRASLPWRHTRDPYAIYVSEVMLQQTQVSTVLERFYFPFLKRFPTLKSLAEASREEVLSAWQGLGYYRRAAHLHEAARQCSGALPRDAESLLQLPGIGRNTANAVASLAHGAPVPVMEANVKRVLHRIFAIKAATEPTLWQRASELLDRKAPADYNQAMMDLGAMVCTPRAPRCGECPASGICAGKSDPESYPKRAKKKKPTVRRKHILLLRNARGEYFAQPREGKFLGGLYHFVERDSPPSDGRRLGRIHQTYSHFTLEATVHLLPAKGRGKSWHRPSRLARLPMSAAEKKILKLLSPHKPA